MLAILGGGPAGLAAAEEAARRGYACGLLKAAPHVGGACATFAWGAFRYDAGAHRLHDRDPVVTAKLRRLMGDELSRVTAPSQIYSGRRLITFPLTASQLPFELGLGLTLSATVDYLRRPRGIEAARTFEDLAVRAYGRRLADLFLLNYSEKLWGVSCSRLSPEAAGRRLSGLNFASLLPRPRRAQPAHMEGAFYYPRNGYGRICDRLAEAVGRDRIRTRSAVTGLLHDGRRVHEVEINSRERLAVEAVCSTLPLDTVVRLLRPAAPAALLQAAGGLRYRSLLMVALFLNKPSVSRNASIYVPDPHVPFTRIVEPRNRSAAMAPDGKTSLVVEIPCFRGDAAWMTDERSLAAQTFSTLEHMGLVRTGELMGYEVRRLSHAYPILEVGVEQTVLMLLRYMDRFDNLAVTGRNGRFAYRHLHDMVRFGADAVDALERAGHLRTDLRSCRSSPISTVYGACGSES